jgi:hypothetical protein
MCPVVDNPNICKICAVIHFLYARNVSAVEMHHELCMVYNQNVTSDGTVRQWRRMFKDGQTNVHDEKQSGQPSAASASCSKCCPKKNVKDGASQLQNFCVNFHKCYTLLSMGLSQFCTTWVLKMLMGVQ